MSFATDLKEILKIKQRIFHSIKRKTEIEGDTPLKNYADHILSIKVDTGEVKPYFLFYDDPPRIQNYVFGGGVEKSLEKQYLSCSLDLPNFNYGKLELGERVWTTSGISNEECSYLGCKPINTNLTYFVQEPTVTENVWPEENE